MAAVRGLSRQWNEGAIDTLLAGALHDVSMAYEYGDPHDMARVYMNDLDAEPRRIARGLRLKQTGKEEGS